MKYALSRNTEDQIEKLEIDIECTDEDFEILWNLHPVEYHIIKMHGKEIPTPRWQQAYGADYRYTGAKQNALEIPPELEPYLTWCQEHVDPRLNGLLLNWYDAESKHYIGKHRDDTRDLHDGSPIVTISLGASRTFRFRPYKGEGFYDFPFEHGEAIVIPADINERFTHEVPHFKRDSARRISITSRAYTSPS